MPAPDDFLAPDEFADVLDTPEFAAMPAHERAAVFDAGQRDAEQWLVANGLEDEASKAALNESFQALAVRHRPAQVDINTSQQGVLGTTFNAMAAGIGPELVGGAIGGAAKLADAGLEMVGLSDPNQRSMLDSVAGFADSLREEGRLFYRTNPANPTAATIGSGAGQAVGMLGTAGIGALANVPRAFVTVPATLGGLLGADQGIDTAQEMGITSGAGKLGMGTAFGAIEGATEMIGGIGGRFLPSPKGLLGAAVNIATESGEEVLSGTAQDALTTAAGQAVEDPNRPGFTETGYKLPGLDADFANRRLQEAIGGAAGGTVFSLVQAAVNRARPAGVGQPMSQATAAEGAAMAEDTGDLTAADVADLEAESVGPRVESPRPSSRQPILSNRMARVQQESDADLAARIDNYRGFLAANPGYVGVEQDFQAALAEQQRRLGLMIPGDTGTEMPVPPPTAEAGAGAGVTVDDWQKRIDAIENRLESQGVDVTRLFNPRDAGTDLLQEAGYKPMPADLADAYAQRDAAGSRALQESRTAITKALQDYGLKPGEVNRVLNYYAIDPNQTDAVAQYLAVQHTVATAKQAGPKQAEALTYALAAERDIPFDELRDIDNPTKRDAANAVKIVRQYLGLDPLPARAAQITGPANRLGLPAATTPAPAAAATSAAGRRTAANQTSGGGTAASPTLAPVAPAASGNLNPQAGRPRAGEAGFVNAEILRDLAASAIQAGQDFVTWARAMLARFGEAVRAQLASIWQQAQAQFQAREVRFGGTVSRMAPAGTRGFVAVPGGENVALSANNPQNAAMASASGAAQANEPSPGGLNEAEARNPMTIYRAGDANEVGVKPWASFTPERSVAEAYTDNPGFGGDTVRELRIDAGNVLDLTSGNKFKKLAEALGFEGHEATDKADEWHSNGWNYPWEESSKVKRALEDSDFDAVQYTDDFPAGATTIIFTREPQLIAPPSFESSRAADGTLNPQAGRPRAGEAGFVNAEILRDLAASAIQAGQDFATWARAMLARFGEAVRAQLAAIWQQAQAQFQAREVRFGGTVSRMAPAGTRGFVAVPGGAESRPNEGQMGPNETQARFASPDAEANVISTRPDTEVLAEAQAWLSQRTPQDALTSLENGSAALAGDAKQRALGLLINQLSLQAMQGSEVQQIVNDTLLNRAGRLWHSEQFSADLARQFRQRNVVNNADLLPVAPVLAAKQVLTDRADRVVKERFEGGAEGAVEKITTLDVKAGTEASAELTAQLEGEPDAPELGDNPEAGGTAKPDAKPRDKAKGSPKQRAAREKINKAQRTAQNILDSLARRYSDPPIFAEGQRRVNAMRELYKERVKTGMPEAEFVKRAMALGANEGTAGILWEASKLEIDAREMMALEKSREGLASYLKKDSPALAKLLDALRKKVAPGMTWAQIFMELPAQQKARQREIYRRLMLDERLKALNQAERLQLTNELDKAWQRERRKVFLRELEKVTNLGKSKKDKDKVKAALPRLLRLMNLGMLNSETFRGAIAQEYGIKQIDAATGVELRKLAEAIQQAPEGLPRRKLEQKLMQRLQNLAGSTLWQVLESWWTASVLSGWRTQVDIGLSLLNGVEDVGLGSIVTALRTGNKDVAVRGLGRLFARVPSAILEAVDHLFTGNKALMRNFELEAKQALEGGNRLASDVGAEMWRKGGWRKVPGGFMIFYGRIMTALDHINTASTREGALAMALARHPELYERALKISPQDRQAARNQARLELTGGDMPTTMQQRLEENARVRELLERGIPQEVLGEATDLGRTAAMQGDPTGLGGGLLEAVNMAVGTVARKAESMSQRENLDRTSKNVLKLLQGIAPIMRAITGTKFARTVAHSLNRSFLYVPVVGIYAVGQRGRTGAFGDVLAAKQVIGTLVGLAMYLAFDDDEDEKGIEDGWKDKTPQEKAQLYAQGKQPYTVWSRNAKGQVVGFNYQQWGIAGIMNTVAAMLKQKDSEQGALNVLVSSLAQGAMTFTDKAQLQGLQTVFGDNYRSTDPVTGVASNLNRWAAQTVGGLVPRVLKDIDVVTSPELRMSSEWWQKWAKEVPMLRQLSSGKRVDILGEDIKLDRGPLSRVMSIGTLDPAYRVLGQLNERDLYLPDPTQGVRMVLLADGTRRKMTELEKDRYQRTTGAAYRKFLTEQGSNLLRMPTEQARETISKVTERLRAQAAYQAVRR